MVWKNNELDCSHDSTMILFDCTDKITGAPNAPNPDQVRTAFPNSALTRVYDEHGIFLLTVIHARLYQNSIAYDDHAATVGMVKEIIQDYGMKYWIAHGIMCLVKWGVLAEEDMDPLLPNIDGPEEQ